VPPEAALRLLRDPHPRGPGLLTEGLDTGLARRRGLRLAGALRDLDLRNPADDEDLLAIGRHVEGAREPLVRDPAGKPAS
jgi:hypothetical protein